MGCREGGLSYLCVKGYCELRVVFRVNIKKIFKRHSFWLLGEIMRTIVMYGLLTALAAAACNKVPRPSQERFQNLAGTVMLESPMQASLMRDLTGDGLIDVVYRGQDAFCVSAEGREKLEGYGLHLVYGCTLTRAMQEEATRVTKSAHALGYLIQEEISKSTD